MRGDVVVVFARVPRLGTVKRRLAAGIGQPAALRFYRTMLARTLRIVASDRRWDAVLALTPLGSSGLHPAASHRARALRFLLPLPPGLGWRAGLRLEAQSRGDLGARMQAAFARRRHRRTVLVGCDIPELSATDLAAAFAALGRADAVFGPALDGGYWLVGMGRRRPAHPFAGVRWSSKHALADTRRNFSNLRVACLRTLRDVDDAADLAAFRRSA